ncbi:MAG TPA: hypothetical protein VGQ52_15780 [Gemmatimonadaceae bacterium]|nr:hypothetical protein [Gemmatimonadaceae bacterium]
MTEPIRFLISVRRFAADRSTANSRRLRAATAEQQGSVMDRARMTDFDCPSYDNDDEESRSVPPGADQLHKRLTLGGT